MNDMNKDDEQDQESGKSKSSGMPFLEHLEELRWRLLKSLFAVIVMSFVAFYYAEYLVKFIRLPLGDIKLYNIAVTGTFYAYLKIALIAGVLGALPIIFYQMWTFIAPGLFKKERKVIFPMVLISTLLFLLGSGFCYTMVLPLSFKFLIGFSGDLIVNTITIGSYISFVGLLLLAFGFGFQMPIIAYFLAKIGILSHTFLVKGRRYSIVVILIVGAIITPPDVFTQVLMAVPLYFLYEVSIIVVRITNKRKEAKEARERESNES